MAYLGPKTLIYLVCKAQITLVLAKKINIFKKYTNFENIFFKKSVIVLLNHLNINKHIIDLKPGKKPSYRPIYSLGPVKLKILKTCIKANLANRFIQLSKSFAKALIFFV